MRLINVPARNLCGEDVFKLVAKCFDHGHIPDGLGSTLITLVPKVQNPLSMAQFRPISLCNTIYKCITKIIVNRLRPPMGKLVSPCQASFIPGRQITYNIVIAQEVLRTFRRTKGRRGFMAWKIDLAKAYDRLKWSFIITCLKDIRISGKLLRLIEDLC